jgi:hypothetical protein
MESPATSTTRAVFEAAWRKLLRALPEASFQKWRDQRDWTARNYAMWERGEGCLCKGGSDEMEPLPGLPLGMRGASRGPWAGPHVCGCGARAEGTIRSPALTASYEPHRNPSS